MLGESEVGATVAVADLARAKSFYADTLGLTIREERPTGILFECGGGTFIDVYPSQFAGTARSTVAGFRVGELDATMSDLRSRGVTFEEYDYPTLKTTDGVAQLGPYRVCWFKDPDGNILSILSRNSG
jgi:catechol 2,3-dioxygenase-like lactoylglutathione lyase family enzyme